MPASTKPTRGILDRLAEGQEQAGEHHHRQDEIGDRAGGDDRRALVAPAAPPRCGRGPPGRSRRAPLVLAARGIGVAVELYVTAEREQRQPPARARRSTQANSSGPKPSEKARSSRRTSGRRGNGRVRGRTRSPFITKMNGTMYQPSQDDEVEQAHATSASIGLRGAPHPPHARRRQMVTRSLLCRSAGAQAKRAAALSRAIW